MKKKPSSSVGLRSFLAPGFGSPGPGIEPPVGRNDSTGGGSQAEGPEHGVKANTEVVGSNPRSDTPISGNMFGRALACWRMVLRHGTHDPYYPRFMAP